MNWLTGSIGPRLGRDMWLEDVENPGSPATASARTWRLGDGADGGGVDDSAAAAGLERSLRPHLGCWLGGPVLEEMTDLPDGVHGLDARGTVAAGDYARAFEPLVGRVELATERLRLLLWFGPAFECITLGALWADSRLGTRYISVMDGCALVTDIDWVREPARGIAPWLPCPMQIYDNASLADAGQWLSALPVRHAPSAAQTAKAYLGGTGGATLNITKLYVTRRFRR